MKQTEGFIILKHCGFYLQNTEEYVDVLTHDLLYCSSILAMMYKHEALSRSKQCTLQGCGGESIRQATGRGNLLCARQG